MAGQHLAGNEQIGGGLVSWPDEQIPALVVGERPTLLEAETGNKVIKALTALGNITIAAGDTDSVEYSGDAVNIIYKGSTGEGITHPSFLLYDAFDNIYTMDFRDGLLVNFFEGTTVPP